MEGTDGQCPNSAETFVVPANTSTPRFFLWGILMLASILLFGPVVRPPQVAHLSRGTLDALIAMRAPALTQVILVVTDVFTPVVAVSWTIVLGDVIRMFSGSWREGLIIPAVTVCSSAITAPIKEFVESTHPTFSRRLVVESSYSFPSRHAAAVTAACAAGVLLILRHLANRIPSDEDRSFPRLPTRIIKGFVAADAITSIVLIAFTYLYLEAYWFSDMVASASVRTTSSPIITELLLGST